jgi:hypothetical protein
MRNFIIFDETGLAWGDMQILGREATLPSFGPDAIKAVT